MEVQATQLDTAVADASNSAANAAQSTGAANDTQQFDNPADFYADDQNPGNEPGQGEADPADPDQQQADEPETAIDPPSSWDKEAKAVFAQLPPEAQTVIAQREAQRDKQVNDVSIRAAEAQRQLQAEAAQQVAQSQQLFAQQLEAVALSYLPPEPNPAQFHDMQSFAQAKFAFDQAHAQHQQLMQQAGQLRERAQQQLQHHEQEAILQDARAVMLDLPELQDAASYQQLKQDLTPIAKELGYSDDRIAQAWPSDLRAMKRVAGWKDKAAKWDALQARKMEGVRAAKNLPKVTQPGPTRGAVQTDDAKALLYPNEVRR